MKQLDDYLKLQQEIYDYFGYKEDWVVIPIDDAREYFWYLEQQDDIGHGEVHFGEVEDELIYSNTIYTQRFLSKWVYRGKDYTMVVVDTHTDGNKFLQIFDNAKELKELPEEK